jgi:hypothetical protein
MTKRQRRLVALHIRSAYVWRSWRIRTTHVCDNYRAASEVGGHKMGVGVISAVVYLRPILHSCIATLLRNVVAKAIAHRCALWCIARLIVQGLKQQLAQLTKVAAI